MTPDQSPVPATAPQLTLFAGGPEPTKALLSLKAGKKDINNDLHKGDEIALLVHARVDEVHFKGDERKHVCTIIDIFEHDGNGQVPAGAALMSSTDSPLPEGPEAEDSTFDRGEDDVVVPPEPVAGDPDLEWQ